jgi:hypothetical protein
MVLINLNYSPNLLQFFGLLFPYITFDVLPSDDIFEWMFTLSALDDKPITDMFDEVGYGSQLLYENLGSLLIF